ncbi:MAG: methyltransferase domain-containing protein [Dactylosporangium sp.]|nr:methyltransferase domain-containing protein [Dactylosporangium sp.]NNJ62511.1 methyltransferase domain-containing protein [Dactylosporangium sp.]
MNPLLIWLADPFFVHPRGWRGRLGGKLMEHRHLGQERWAVRRSEVRPGARVLAIGHGPGIGLELAADAVGPGGQVIGVEPSEVMREAAARRCAAHIAAGTVVLRDGSAECTGCADGCIDVATSVNNVMMWDLAAAFAEIRRVLRPTGSLVITAHRYLLNQPAEQVVADARQAGFADAWILSADHGPVEIIARRS